MNRPGLVPLRDARDEQLYGGKAVQLGAALAAGLPVPDGLALTVDAVESVAAGDADAIDELGQARQLSSQGLAVRSSAVGEDSVLASFAGQHRTVLGVRLEYLPEAVKQVFDSATAESAALYRRRRGVAGRPRTGAVIQPLLRADIAGVLFTADPVSGMDRRLIEASWGLGPSVVEGLVVPDRYVLDRSGKLVEHLVGHKTVTVGSHPESGTIERSVDPAFVAKRCLEARHLEALHRLAGRCEEVFGSNRDVEFAFVGDRLHLLQCRPMTS